MNILVSAKNVYGVQTIYPECEKASLFAKIAGTKTLTQETIENIKKLGYEINIKHIELSL